MSTKGLTHNGMILVYLAVCVFLAGVVVWSTNVATSQSPLQVQDIKDLAAQSQCHDMEVRAVIQDKGSLLMQDAEHINNVCNTGDELLRQLDAAAAKNKGHD